MEEINIPHSWEIVRLGDFVEHEKGKKPKSQINTPSEEYCEPYIDIEAFEKGILKSWTNGEGCRLCSESDFLIVWDGSRSGLVGKGMNGALGSTLVRINFPHIENNYAYYFLQSKFLEINSRTKGSGTPHVDPDLLWNYDFPIPPTNEQHRIVAKLEKLFSELNKGVESLKTVREQLKVYRQAVLKHAFEGKLTEQWREENNDKLETKDQFFTRIQRERDTRYERRLNKWEEAVNIWKAKNKSGKKPLKPRVPKKITRLLKSEMEALSELPDGYFWEKLGWMTCGVEYGTGAKSSESGKVPVLRMGNIQNAMFDWNDLVYTSDEAEIKKYLLQSGDVLFNRTNSPELVGKTAIYRGERPAIFAGYLIRVNQIESVADSQYLNLFLNAHIAKQHGNKVKTDGVNQSNINGEKLQNYPFPYCALAEQHEIVWFLEEKLSVIDQLEHDIDQELKKSNALRQSVLNRAFSGHIIAQDPNDEPSSVLLGRIKVEKAEQENNSKKNKRMDAA